MTATVNSNTKDLVARVADSILTIASRVPKSHEHSSSTPEQKARSIANRAAAQAAVTAGALALPPGPLKEGQ